MVSEQVTDLDVEGAGMVDAGVVEYADGRITWSRFENLVAAKIVEADPEAAAEKERAAAAEEFVKVGRSNRHGQVGPVVRWEGHGPISTAYVPFPGIYLWRDPTAGSTSSTTPAQDHSASPGRADSATALPDIA